MKTLLATYIPIEKAGFNLRKSFCLTPKIQIPISIMPWIMKFQELKTKATNLKSQVLTLYFVSKDKRLPFHIKAIAIFCVAYALSPIDLIPDFIPVIGLLDDLIIIPLCLALVIKLTPREIMESAKALAEKSNLKPVSYLAGVAIVGAWISIFLFLIFKYYS